jgi:hypothetical protein
MKISDIALNIFIANYINTYLTIQIFAWYLAKKKANFQEGFEGMNPRLNKQTNKQTYRPEIFHLIYIFVTFEHVHHNLSIIKHCR